MSVPRRLQPLALVVDDDPMILEVLGVVLNKFGLATELTNDAQVFLAQARRLKPELCLVDLNLNSLGEGFSVVDELRLLLGKNVKIVVISGVSEKSAVEAMIDRGADDYLVKPLDRHVLAAKLSRYVTTEQLLGFQRSLFPVPEGGAAATVYVDLEMSKLDERGIFLRGPHLLSKGISVHLDGPTIHEITGAGKPLFVTISETWAEEGKEGFGALALFDATDEETLANVRGWIQRNRVSTRAASGSDSG